MQRHCAAWTGELRCGTVGKCKVQQASAWLGLAWHDGLVFGLPCTGAVFRVWAGFRSGLVRAERPVWPATVWSGFLRKGLLGLSGLVSGVATIWLEKVWYG